MNNSRVIRVRQDTWEELEALCREFNMSFKTPDDVLREIIEQFWRFKQMEWEDIQMLIRICAWCGSSLGEPIPSEYEGITHGICGECAERVRAEYREEQEVNRGTRTT